MIPTPYLKPFNTEGGTLYVFPSVSKDLTRTLVSNDYEFKFSHFACLNIPDFLAGTYGEDSDSDPTNDMPKGLYIDTLYNLNGQSGSEWTSNGLGKAIAENLQNYVMNFETAILNGEGDNDDYNNDILTNVSEKVFWNWMQKVGAIKFDNDKVIENFTSYGDRTVQYLGDIDVMNTVEVNGDAFEELYIHIPSTAGASTTVHFRTGDQTDNKNYLNKNYPIGIINPENNLIGRENNGEPHNGLNTKPLYDKDTGANIYTGDTGYTIDFRNLSYDGGINQMNVNSLENFQFNAVLIYYDIFEKTTTPGVKKTATNLYGILFLDNVWVDGGKYFLQRYPKIKETVYGNGNSYALKIDLKVDTIGDTNDVIITRDDSENNDAVSMSLYEKAITQLQKCIDLFYEQRTTIKKLEERIDNLENLVMGIDSISSIRDDINRLYDLYTSNAVVDTSTLLGLIDANAARLENIATGGKDIKLQFDTDVLQSGSGISLTKSDNKLIISSEDKYSINEVKDGSGTVIDGVESNVLNTSSENKSCNIQLRPGENFAVLYLKDTGNSPDDLIVNIDSTTFNWSVGQSLKLMLVFNGGGSLQFDNSMTTGIVIKPNSNVTDSIPGYKIEGNDLIEIICISDEKFIYLIK